jgi:hypothetical protein
MRIERDEIGAALQVDPPFFEYSSFATGAVAVATTVGEI